METKAQRGEVTGSRSRGSKIVEPFKLKEPHSSAVHLSQRAELILTRMNGSQRSLSRIDLNPLHQGCDLHTDPSLRTSEEAGTNSRGTLQATVSAISCHHLGEWKASIQFPHLHLELGSVLLKHQLKQCDSGKSGAASSPCTDTSHAPDDPAHSACHH